VHGLVYAAQRMTPPSRSLVVAPALAALLLAAGCVTVARQDGAIVPVEPDPRYDALFPYYVELCAVTQIRANFAPHGGTPGHAAMYLKGACRSSSTPYPTLEICDDSEDLTDPDTGSGVSVNKMFRNVNWMATRGKRLFYHGDLDPGETLDVETGLAAIYAAEAAGTFEGVEVHQSFLPPEDDEDREEAMLFLAAAETLGTDFALSFGRTVYCARVPLERRQLSDVIEYLNDLNSDYARGGKDYQWSGYNDNCSHTLHNSLAEAGVWKPKSIASFRFGQLANLSVPANEFIDLALLSITFPIDDLDAIMADDALRNTLARRGWLPTRHGAMLQVIPVHQPNELYETDAAIFLLTNPFRKGRVERVSELFDDPHAIELETNLLHFQELYSRVLAERPAGWKLEPRASADLRARDHYYRYIEAQLADVNEKLELLQALASP